MVGSEAIRYGMFIMPFHPADKPLDISLAEDLELVCLAEKLGFTEFWIGEHHTMKYEPVVMPELFIARAIAETSSIRLGAAPVCLNQHHPAHVACRLAFLDHLAGGRLNLCFGAGSVTADQELYGVEPSEGTAMAEEAIQIIRMLWDGDPPYHYEGNYWNIDLQSCVDEETGIGFIRSPLQDPIPKIAIPAMSRNSSSMKMAGRCGYTPFAHCLVTGNVVADFFHTYESSARQSGRTPDRQEYRVARSIFIADSTAEAVAMARSNSLGQNYEYIGRLFDKGLGRGIYKRDPEMSDTDCNMDFLLGEQIIAGDVDEVLRRLLELINETGEFGTLILMGYDWDDRESWTHSMELFAREVMPALNAAVGPIVARLP